MMFNVTADGAGELIGYFVPDDAQKVGVVAVVADGGEIWRGPTSTFIEGLLATGRHATGVCGFRLEAADVRALATAQRLEVLDAESGMLLYRRHIDRTPARMLRFETSLSPQTRLDTWLAPHFTTAHSGVERLGHETVMQLLLLLNTPSQYVAGRVNLPAFEQYLHDGVLLAAAIQDPYAELAERLTLLTGRGAATTGARLAPRDRMLFGAAIEAFADVDPHDEKALRRVFRRLDRRVAIELSNPLTRQLTTRTPGDLCASDAAATALRTLSDFAVVGLRELGGHFEHAAADCLGVAPPPSALGAAPCMELTAALCEIRIVEALLEFDLEVYDAVATAVERVSADADAEAAAL